MQILEKSCMDIGCQIPYEHNSRNKLKKNSPVQAPHYKFTTKLFCRISIFSRLRTARFALLFRTLRNLSRANSEYCDMNVQRRGSANHSKYSFRCNLHYSHAARCLVTISRTVRTIMGVDNPILAHPVYILL